MFGRQPERTHDLRGRMSEELPSRFQLGDKVRIVGQKDNHAITAVCFRAGKVTYEVAGMMFESEHITNPITHLPGNVVSIG